MSDVSDEANDKIKKATQRLQEPFFFACPKKTVEPTKKNSQQPKLSLVSIILAAFVLLPSQLISSCTGLLDGSGVSSRVRCIHKDTLLTAIRARNSISLLH
jgi:hypothetical protein